MLISFSRRLSYLHDSGDARALVERWLAPGGRFHALPPNDDFTLVRNLAPVAPDLVLSRMSDHLAGPGASDILSPSNIHRSAWIDLLKSLAFEASHFDQAAVCLALFVAAETEQARHSSAKGHFKELFQLYLSGTRAEPAQRIGLIRALLADPSSALAPAGREALSALFEIGHFSSSSSFDFGARPRDYGWTPSNDGQILSWYDDAIALVLELMSEEEAKAFLEDHLRSLWTQGASLDVLEATCLRLAAHGGWNGAWLAFRSVLRFDAEGVSADARARLQRLITALEPVGLLPRARAIVLVIGVGTVDLEEEDFDSEGEAIVNAPSAADQARAIGAAMAADAQSLSIFLPEVIAASAPPRAFEFGEGLGGATSDLASTWRTMTAAHEALAGQYRNPSALAGFLLIALSRDSQFVADVLDSAPASPHLAPHLAYFHGVLGVDSDAFERMTAALEAGTAQPNHYSRLFIRELAPEQVGELARFLDALSTLDGGDAVAMEILHGALRRNPALSPQALEPLITVGRALLMRIDFTPRGVMHDQALEALLVHCLPGASPQDAAAICRRAWSTLARSRGSSYTPSKRILGRIFQAQPTLALDLFLLNPPSELRWMFDNGVSNGSPVAELPASVLCDWAGVNPADRWPRLSRALSLFDPRRGEKQTAPASLFMDVLARAPDKAAFLGPYHNRLQPGSWGGSLAEMLDRRRRAILESDDADLIRWAMAAEADHNAWVRGERENERRREESFE